MNALLAWDNAVVDALAIYNDGWWTYTPSIGNLGKQSLGQRWISPGLAAADTRFTCGFTTAAGDPVIQQLALATHNLTLGATVRVRASNSATFATTLWDSGTLPAYVFGTTEAQRKGMRQTFTVQVGSGQLLGNTDFASGTLSPWYLGFDSTGGTNYSASVDLGGAPQIPTGTHQAGVYRFGNARTGLLDFAAGFTPVDGGQTYELSAYLASLRGDCDLGVAWFEVINGAYTYISEQHFAPAARAAGGTSLSNWARVGGTLVAPQRAVVAVVFMRTFATDTAQTDSYYWITRAMLAVAVPGANALRAWMPQTKAAYWRVEIADASNPAGYVSVGRLAAFTQRWQPSVNMLMGAGLGWESNFEIQKAIGGAEWFTEAEAHRTARFNLHPLPMAEMMSGAFDLVRNAAGARREVLFQYDPGDTAQLVRRTIFGRLRQLSPIEEPQFGYLQTAFEVKELL